MQHQQPTPTLYTKKSEGIRVVSAGSLYRVIAAGKNTGGRFSVMEAILEPGQSAPYHVHTKEDEAFFILEGEVTFYLEGSEITAIEEDFLSCPPGTTRGFANHTNALARMLLIYSTAGVEEMTISDGQRVEPGVKASDLVSSSKAQCPQLANRYGIYDSQDPLGSKSGNSDNKESIPC